MTVEAALAKLSYLLSKEDLTTERIRELLGTNLRGEMTIPVDNNASVQFTAGAATQDARLKKLFGYLIGPLQSSLEDTEFFGSSSFQTAQDADSLDDDESRSRIPMLGSVIYEPLASEDQLLAIEHSLLPMVLGQAAAKNDGSLKTLIDEYLDLPAKTPGKTHTTIKPVIRRAPTLSSSSSFLILNTPCNTLSQTPLHIAAAAGMVANVTLLLSHAASVHLRDSAGHTPLGVALRFGKWEVVREMRKAGGNLSETEFNDPELAVEVVKRAKGGDDAALGVFEEVGITLEKARRTLEDLLK
jgi:60kDa lysophospholipase